MKLGSITRVWQCTEDDRPDEDTTMIARIGNAQTVGKVVDEADKGTAIPLSKYICIKPLDKNKLLPRYLYYAMQYVHMEGYWRRVSTPYLGDKHKITITEVRNVQVKETF